MSDVKNDELLFGEEAEDELLDWDDEIEVENDYTVLPAGKYDFEVVNFERSQFDGSAKLPACKMAIVTFKIKAEDGKTSTVFERYYLCKKMEGMLSALFKACGLKKKGEKTVMKWSELVGSTGRCKIEVHEYNGRESNRITTLYAKED
ncbi:MAG: DUF669 domain-containing protein [Clostridiales bacterium]|nr:DUF669 domain-containing protein [Clostridiales bacterium]